MDAIADQETEHIRLADSLKQRLSPQGITTTTTTTTNDDNNNTNNT